MGRVMSIKHSVDFFLHLILTTDYKYMLLQMRKWSLGRLHNQFKIMEIGGDRTETEAHVYLAMMVSILTEKELTPLAS